MTLEETVPVGTQLLASSMSGLLADTFGHPLENIKARLQTQHLFKNQRGFTTFSSPLDVVRKTYSLEGGRAFFRGFVTVPLCSPIGYALCYTSEDLIKHRLQRIDWLTPSSTQKHERGPRDKSGPLIHFLSGVMAQCLASTIFVPMDIVKQKAFVKQVRRDSPKKVSAREVAQTMWKEEGIAGFYRGLGPYLLAFVPYVGLYFVFYEKLRKEAAHLSHTDVRHLPFHTYLLCSGLSGATAAWLTNPLDVLKSRIQVQSKQEAMKTKYSTGIDGFREILRQEGPRAFFHGAVPRAVWLGTLSALSMGFFEKFKTLIHDGMTQTKEDPEHAANVKEIQKTAKERAESEAVQKEAQRMAEKAQKAHNGTRRIEAV